MGMEKLVGDEGEDGGAAGRDASPGDLGEQTREELADVLSGGEFGEAARKEIGGKVGGVIGKFRNSKALAEMLRAEAGMGWRGREAAAHAIVKAMVAAARVLVRENGGCFGERDGVGGEDGHDFSLVTGGTPGRFVWM